MALRNLDERDVETREPKDSLAEASSSEDVATRALLGKGSLGESASLDESVSVSTSRG